MKPHLYYALKHFCNSELQSNYGLFWTTKCCVCSYTLEVFDFEDTGYFQKFTYHYKTLDRPLGIIDNYHTQKLYEWLTKR